MSIYFKSINIVFLLLIQTDLESSKMLWLGIGGGGYADTHHQRGPLSLVEECRGLALIGQELKSV